MPGLTPYARESRTDWALHEKGALFVFSDNCGGNGSCFRLTILPHCTSAGIGNLFQRLRKIMTTQEIDVLSWYFGMSNGGSAHADGDVRQGLCARRASHQISG